MLLGNKSYKERMICSKEYNDSNWTASYIASNFNALLKYFRGYWETTKIFLLNICGNEIIPDENLPDYGNYNSYLTVMSSIYIPHLQT